VDSNERDATVPFWLTPTSYWLPTHYPGSAWTTHAPFAAWLVDTLRPTTIVELGSYRGFSCFAFAEAAKRLGLPTRIFALDTWEGDEHGGFYGQEVYDYVAAVVEADYSDSVTLTRGFFTDSRRLFEDGSVDIVHIDGRHGYEDAKADFEEYVTAVRDGGIVMFHDIAEHREGFGVFQLWDEIADPGRSFTFEHGHGLGILAVGRVPDGPLGELFRADAGTAERIRADFVRLGNVVAHRALLETHSAQYKRQTAALKGSKAKLAAMRSSTSWRITKPLRAVGRLLHR